MAVAHEHLDVGDAVVRRAGREDVAKRQRRKGRVSAGAATAYRKTIAVDLSDRSQVLGGCDRVVDVRDTPVAFELRAIGPAEAGRSSGRVGRCLVDLDAR